VQDFPKVCIFLIGFKVALFLLKLQNSPIDQIVISPQVQLTANLEGIFTCTYCCGDLSTQSSLNMTWDNASG